MKFDVQPSKAIVEVKKAEVYIPVCESQRKAEEYERINFVTFDGISLQKFDVTKMVRRLLNVENGDNIIDVEIACRKRLPCYTDSCNMTQNSFLVVYGKKPRANVQCVL